MTKVKCDSKYCPGMESDVPRIFSASGLRLHDKCKSKLVRKHEINDVEEDDDTAAIREHRAGITRSGG